MLNLARKDSFRHGIHPPEMKQDTSHLAIRRFPFAPLLVVPLSQHLGKPAKAIVRAGQEVVRGQTIAEADKPINPKMLLEDIAKLLKKK